MVDVEITAPTGHSLRDAALIDTGADSSAFPVHWMYRLGIYKKDCKRRRFDTAGGGGVQWTYEPGVQAIILGKTIALNAAFVDTPVALLGRDDFLTHFHAAFDRRALTVTLKPYPTRRRAR